QCKKFLIFKPKYCENRREYLLDLWRFAFRMIKKLNKYYQGCDTIFDVCNFIKKKYEIQFTSLYEKYNNNKITSEEESKLKYISDILDHNTLCQWLHPSIQNLFLDLKKVK